MFFTLFGVEKYAKTLEETFPFFLYKFWGFWDFATKLFGKLNFSIPNLIHLLIQCIVLDDDTFFSQIAIMVNKIPINSKKLIWQSKIKGLKISKKLFSVSSQEKGNVIEKERFI